MYVANHYSLCTGDMVGPGLSPYENDPYSFNVLNGISSEGETYAFDHGVKIYWLKYLCISNQLRKSTLSDTLANANKGSLYNTTLSSII